MKAVRIHSHGHTEVLKIDTLTEPHVGVGQVLVKTAFAALNHLDLFVRAGIPGVPLPLIMGSDASGIITKVGAGVSKLKVGDAVIHVPFRIPENEPLKEIDMENLSPNYTIPGEHMDGVQAQFFVVDERYLVKKPETLTMEEAAALPLAALTAYHMLVRKAKVKKGDKVLVWGASSGVGSAAIQIAKAFGAFVITTVGDEAKRKYATQFGADYILNYKEDAVGKKVKEITGKGVDIVFEHPGKASWKESLRALKIGGKLVTCGATTGFDVKIDLRALFIKQQHLIGSTMGTIKDLNAVCALAEQNKLRLPVSKIFKAEQIEAAHTFLEKNQQSGKVLIYF